MQWPKEKALTMVHKTLCMQKTKDWATRTTKNRW